MSQIMPRQNEIVFGEITGEMEGDSILTKSPTLASWLRRLTKHPVYNNKGPLRSPQIPRIAGNQKLN